MPFRRVRKNGCTHEKKKIKRIYTSPQHRTHSLRYGARRPTFVVIVMQVRRSTLPVSFLVYFNKRFCFLAVPNKCFWPLLTKRRALTDPFHQWVHFFWGHSVENFCVRKLLTLCRYFFCLALKFFVLPYNL